MTVNYNGKTVSDENIRTVLERIASLCGPVRVTSGDRNHVPPGGSRTSHHLQKRAADFYVEGMSLAELFKNIRDNAASIFDPDKRYQLIHHGIHTATGGPHVHVGRWSDGSGVDYRVEGLTARTKGKYTKV